MKKLKVTILESIHKDGVKKLEEFCDVTYALNSSAKELIEVSKKSDVIIVKSVTKVNQDLIAASPYLKVIARAGTGLDNIDVDYAKNQGKKVLSVPTGNTISAAEFSVMMILNSFKKSVETFQRIGKNDFRRSLLQGKEVKNSKIGIIGLGNVGIEVAKRLSCFEATMLGWDVSSKNKERFKEFGGIFVSSLDEATRDADLITLHSNLNQLSKGMIDKKFLSNLKPGTLLVNCARGGLVIEKDILWALDQGLLASYATDVILNEPPYDKKPEEHSYTHPFLSHPNISYTPHLAASTNEAQQRISISLAEQIRDSLI